MRVSARGALLCSATILFASITCRTVAYPVGSYAGKFAAAYPAWWSHYGGYDVSGTNFSGPFVTACLACHSSDPTASHPAVPNATLCPDGTAVPATCNYYGLAFKNSGTNLPDGSFDTDSDTYANNVEITAFTFPGNRSPHHRGSDRSVWKRASSVERVQLAERQIRRASAQSGSELASGACAADRFRVVRYRRGHDHR